MPAKPKTRASTTSKLRDLAQPQSPLVFLSHDSRDAELAEAFEMLLTDVSGGVLKIFRSTDRTGSSGIEFGAEWYRTIMTKLSSATDVVALLTKNSLDRPWILYEVGVARGRLETPAFGVVFGVPLNTIAGPFAQFQNSNDDEESLTTLVLQLVSRIPGANPRREAVRKQVAAFRSELPQKLRAMGAVPESRPTEAETVVKLFEEVKVMFREIREAVTRQFGVRSIGEERKYVESNDPIQRLFRDTEASLRNLAKEIIRQHYPDLADAVRDNLISPAAAKRGLSRLSFGEIRDILRQFHRTNHKAAANLPSLQVLDRLQAVIDVRNRLLHGEDVTSGDLERALTVLYEIQGPALLYRTLQG